MLFHFQLRTPRKEITMNSVVYHKAITNEERKRSKGMREEFWSRARGEEVLKRLQMYRVFSGVADCEWVIWLQLRVYRPSLPSSGQLQHFSGTRTSWASLFSLNFIFLLLYFDRPIGLNNLTVRTNTVQRFFLLTDASLAFTLTDIQKVLGWLLTQRILHMKWCCSTQCYHS